MQKNSPSFAILDFRSWLVLPKFFKAPFIFSSCRIFIRLIPSEHCGRAPSVSCDLSQCQGTSSLFNSFLALRSSALYSQHFVLQHFILSTSFLQHFILSTSFFSTLFLALRSSFLLFLALRFSAIHSQHFVHQHFILSTSFFFALF